MAALKLGCLCAALPVLPFASVCAIQPPPGHKVVKFDKGTEWGRETTPGIGERERAMASVATVAHHWRGINFILSAMASLKHPCGLVEISYATLVRGLVSH